MSTNCNKCEDKAWCWSCVECQSKPYLCFIFHTIDYNISDVDYVSISIDTDLDILKKDLENM